MKWAARSTGLQNGGRSLHQYNGSKSRHATTFNHIFELSAPMRVTAWRVVQRDILGFNFTYCTSEMYTDGCSCMLQINPKP